MGHSLSKFEWLRSIWVNKKIINGRILEKHHYISSSQPQDIGSQNLTFRAIQSVNTHSLTHTTHSIIKLFHSRIYSFLQLLPYYQGVATGMDPCVWFGRFLMPDAIPDTALPWICVSFIFKPGIFPQLTLTLWSLCEGEITLHQLSAHTYWMTTSIITELLLSEFSYVRQPHTSSRISDSCVPALE